MRLHLIIALVFCGALGIVPLTFGDPMYLLQATGNDGIQKQALVVQWEEMDRDETVYGCEIFTDKKLIAEASNDLIVHRPTQEELDDIFEECSTSPRRRRRDARYLERGDSDNVGDRTCAGRGCSREESAEGPKKKTTDGGYSGWNIIFPGTKWCGPGDRAKNYDDLGLHQDTDRCCRAHDNCNGTLGPGEKIGDLPNQSSFTQLSCQCDNDFYDCLSRVDSVTSNTIGNAYFNLAARQCYEKDHPISSKCLKYRSFLKITCSEYAKDTTAPPRYLWKPSRKYKKLPVPGPLTITLPF